MIKDKLPILLSIGFFALFACQPKPKTVIRPDLDIFYKPYSVVGSLVLFDQKNNTHVFYNAAWFKEPFIPASTFKICNSLIGLETGVIPDENYVIKWDSVVRQNPDWNHDTDLKTAYKNSTVWYYQELARRVGGERMKTWLDKAAYGNADISGGIDQFWLKGGLRISPAQQIDFLKRLHDNTLPFSQRSVDIVKKIMIDTQGEGYTVRAKTGWGEQNHREIGWFVGYLETSDNVIYFANCVQMPDTSTNYVNFDNSRKEVVYKVLEYLKYLPAAK